jgi:hypothetical protein
VQTEPDACLAGGPGAIAGGTAIAPPRRYPEKGTRVCPRGIGKACSKQISGLPQVSPPAPFYAPQSHCRGPDGCEAADHENQRLIRGYSEEARKTQKETALGRDWPACDGRRSCRLNLCLHLEVCCPFPSHVWQAANQERLKI